MGSTGYVVLVQSRHSDAAYASFSLGRTASLLAAVSLGALLCLWLVTFRLSHRRA